MNKPSCLDMTVCSKLHGVTEQKVLKLYLAAVIISNRAVFELFLLKIEQMLNSDFGNWL